MKKNRYNHLSGPSQLIHQLHDYPINLFNLKFNYMQKLKTKITGLAFFLVIVCISCDKDDRLVGFVSMIALENNNICLVAIHEGPKLGVTGLNFSNAIQLYIPDNRTVKLAYTIKFNCRAYDPAIDGVILDAFTIPHPSESYDPRDPKLSNIFRTKSLCIIA